MSSLIRIYAVCKSPLLSHVAVKELNIKPFYIEKRQLIKGIVMMEPRNVKRRLRGI